MISPPASDLPVPQAAPGVPLDEWRRLHPLSPLVRLGGVAVFIVFLVLSRSGAPPSPRAATQATFTLFMYLGLGLLLVLGGVVSWVVTRWRIHGGDLQIEMGLIRRQSFRIPLERVQAIDVVAPFTARLLGLAEVRVISAGRGLERGRLAYLRAGEAPVVRAQLLALAHGLAAETPPPPARHLMQVNNVRLLAALLLRGPTMVWFLITVVAPTAFALVAQGTGGVAAATTFSVSVVFFSIGLFRLLNEEWGVTISDSPDGLRLDRGLLQRRHETIPFGRIQGVRWVEPLLWRLCGWSRLEVDVARQSVSRRADADASRVARVLMPVARREETAWLLAHVLPGAAIFPPPGSAPPPRARWKAPLSYHLLRSWRDEHYVSARTGRVRAATVILPLWKIQSVRLEQGPLQRLFRLASVHVDTAGRRWTAPARCRDQAEAFSMLEGLATAARDARLRAAAAQIERHQA